MVSALELFHQTQIDVLSGPPMCQVTITSNKTFTPGFPNPPQVLTWDAANFDPFGFWSAGVNPSRITPNISGYYLCIGIFDWADTGASTGSRIINLNKNGGGTGVGAGGVNTIGQATISPASDSAFIFTMTLSAIGFFNGSTDYLEAYGWQNWTGNNTVIQSGRTSLTLARVHY